MFSISTKDKPVCQTLKNKTVLSNKSLNCTNNIKFYGKANLGYGNIHVHKSASMGCMNSWLKPKCHSTNNGDEWKCSSETGWLSISPILGAPCGFSPNPPVLFTSLLV